MAAGMTLKAEDVAELRDRLNQMAEETLTEEDFIPVQEVDLVCGVEDITVESITELKMLSPFGMLNPKPHVMVKNAVLDDVRLIGSNKNHVKMTVKSDSAVLTASALTKGSLKPELSPDQRFPLSARCPLMNGTTERNPS